ncbi:LytR/AlgR family response regulator transcription factor [Clostridium formicaceticum]|uniref:LytR/AlgR family response regulator transcription factor n=1 Tax=Clostridium formicaceticum TaxID=1497 RepID=UPI0012EA5C14|nr:LytTR family DNA-binding domain-containing protein [Clostridium formicaceticum]
MSAILIDDEKVSLQELTYMLVQYKEIQILGTFTDPVEALKEIPKLNPDVIFLDIEMPEVNGFEVAEQIEKLSVEPAIVFVTAYDEYAIRAFEVNAVDYILKPISPKRIRNTLQKLMKKKFHPDSQGKKKYVSRQKSIDFNKVYDNRFSKVFIYQGEEIILLKPSDILYFMVEGGVVTVVTQQKTYKTRESLNYWEEKLQRQGFFRCHRCYLVNLEKIEKVILMFNSTYLLKLASSTAEIPVSRNYSKLLKQILI